MLRCRFSFLVLILFSVSLNLSLAQSLLPPAKYDGFLYKVGEVDSDSILIEAFFDPVCPDSRDTWPALKQVIHHYGSRASLILHLLPLPYHDNAYVTSRALHIANSLNASSTFPLLERFFKYQGKFYNAETRNISRVAVVKKIVKFAAHAVGNSYYSSIESGFNDRQTDLKTRVSFKYSTSRGVYGTPTFYINGFVLPDAGSPLDFNGWKKIIDPLVHAKKDTNGVKEENEAVEEGSFLAEHTYPLFFKMDRYQRVEKPKAETPIDENEIRITSQGRMRSYISYAMSLLQEKGSDEIVFKAMGRAINKTVTIVELIKRRIVGLHQITSIGSTDITDTWEPLEEGLLPLETTRHVSMITITLSKKELNISAIGYQPPLPAELVKGPQEFDFEGEGSPNRGRGRGGRGRPRGRGNGFIAEYEDGGWDRGRGYGRGRGRGRGRGFRGRGRGGYNGPHADMQQDGGYNNYDAPAQGRGGYNNYDGPPQGRGGYNNYDGPPQGRGGYNNYDGPAPGRGRGRGRGNRGRGRGGFKAV
ncbi:Alba DNA/RNA-binding protein [Euphorbia peplus]|nr:Alba DNA/RNA-binding protein [Euphorbia peplus]